MMQDKYLFFGGAMEWRTWLRENGTTEKIAWLLFYKKETGKSGISYSDALDEALCLGWVDSLVKKIDEERYVRKFTPRNDNSVWSEVNKKHIARLIKEGRMQPEGTAKVEAAKQSGEWDKNNSPLLSVTFPPELQAVLDRHPGAKAHFERMPPSHRRNYVGWITSAKKPETQMRRLDEAIRLLGAGKNLGLK
jgi:uncharacterized protein YdeI (YjbR/CyaY-like superfamily)